MCIEEADSKSAIVTLVARAAITFRRMWRNDEQETVNSRTRVLDFYALLWSGLMYVKKSNGLRKHLDFIISDVIILEISLLMAHIARFNLVNPFADSQFIFAMCVMFFLDLAVIALGNFYSGILKRGFVREFQKVFIQTGILFMLALLILFAVHVGSDYSRLFFLYCAAIYFFLEYTFRILYKMHLREKNSNPGKSRLLVVTTTESVETAAFDVTRAIDPGVFVMGIVLMDGGEDSIGTEYSSLKVLTNGDGFIDYITRSWVDEILFVLPDNANEFKDLIEEVVQSGITTHLSLGKAESRIGRKQQIENIEGFAVLTTSINQLSFAQAFFKRATDIVGGLLGSILAIIAIIIIGPIIFIKSPGPILFKQKRVGCNGKTFNFLKIRSMVMNADAKKAELMEQNRVKDGMMFKLDFDPRIIGAKVLPDGRKKKGIGNFIRDWSIDELPQFFNVLMGDMSLVGTRPPTMDEWNKYKLHHRARLAFKPGITGLWQVSGRSEITDFEEVVKLDRQYIEDWSYGLDCRIMIKTVKAVLKREGSM